MSNFKPYYGYVKYYYKEKFNKIKYVNSSYPSILDSKSLEGKSNCRSINSHNNKCHEKCLIPTGILLEIYNNSLILENNQAIPFNLEKVNTDKRNLIFDAYNNTLILVRPGLYVFDWWIGVEGSNSNRQLKIDIETTNSRGKKDSFPTTHPIIITGLFYGQGLVTTNEPLSVRLINSSNASMSLSNHTDMQGSLKVVAFYS
ncbi:hypothetical protein [Clostridium sp.]|uniref:hypothetical protein n=1 Tax=Clostridium sp. TaxID=1506 RepID=UPI003F3DE244